MDEAVLFLFVLADSSLDQGSWSLDSHSCKESKEDYLNNLSSKDITNFDIRF